MTHRLSWRFRLSSWSVVIVCIALSSLATAAELAAPRGPVVLSISGKITEHNREHSAELDRDMLDALPQHTIETQTPWTNGQPSFRGPLLRDILALVGAQGDRLIAEALNQYRIEIPIEDAMRYPVIIATHLDGKRLRVREKGPLWVIYPWSRFDELDSESYYHRSIWHLNRITVE